MPIMPTETIKLSPQFSSWNHFEYFSNFLPSMAEYLQINLDKSKVDIY